MRETYRSCLDEGTASVLEAFLRDGRPVSEDAARAVNTYALVRLADVIGPEPEWGDEELACVSFMFQVSRNRPHPDFFPPLSGVHEQEVLRIMETCVPPSDFRMYANVCLGRHNKVEWDEGGSGDDSAPFRSPFANFVWHWGDLDRARLEEPLVAVLAKRRPDVIARRLTDAERGAAFLAWGAPGVLLPLTTRFDEDVVRAIESWLVSMPRNGSSDHDNWRRATFIAFHKWDEARGGRWRDRVTELAATPEFAGTTEAVTRLLVDRPHDVLRLVLQSTRDSRPWRADAAYQRLITLAATDFDGDGGRLLVKLLEEFSFCYGLAEQVHRELLVDPASRHSAAIRKIYLDHAATLKPHEVADFWAAVAPADGGIFEPEWEAMVRGKSERLRAIAASWLAARKPTATDLAGALLDSPRIDERIGGATLLMGIGSSGAADRLIRMRESEPSKQVRQAIAKLLEKAGHRVEPEPEQPVVQDETLGALQQRLEAKSKSIRWPAGAWLAPEKLPPLFALNDEPLSGTAVSFLCQRQAREKPGCVSREVEPLLRHLDHSRNAPFAHALLDQWFQSDMGATTRWALEVAALTGDDTVIVRLVQPIPNWCKANATKRARWAVRAIAMLGTPAALQALDGLIHRHRSQRRYIASEAREAIDAWAALQGVGADEMADRMTPDLGFDADGCRRFDMAGGGSVTARLGPDLKVDWIPAEGRKTAAPPKGLSPAASADAKAMLRLLKETTTTLKARLEEAMIGGRRWNASTWIERFEQHPLFRCFAVALVWNVLDSTGRRTGTFRRYPNGILADAAGQPQELEGAEWVSLVHPADMPDEELAAWREHLDRFGITQPFPQIRRAVERMDALHGNRREIRIVEGRTLDAADLRGRAFGRGWALGPTGGGGFVGSCFKRFPAAGVDAHLAVEDFHSMSGRGTHVVLGTALFAEAGQEGQPAWLPTADEKHVLRLDQVPAVVWSETLADLKAIAGEPAIMP